MHTLGIFGKLALAGVAGLAVFVSPGAARAGFTVLYAFDGSGGDEPNGLIQDAAGNLYGTTYLGGIRRRHTICSTDGCGTVFKLAPDGTERVLYAFPGKKGHGAFPLASLIQDSAGNLYGTTSQGGTGCNCGTVFKLTSDGTETVLYAFPGGSKGAYPRGGLIRDKAGNLYSTTSVGGDIDCMPNLGGCGIVFELAPNGTETVLHVFTGGSDGANPFAGLIRDKAGNLYGTTINGGVAGLGTVFKVAPDGTETVLYAFTGENGDGVGPDDVPIEDRYGNLYGTTEFGGAHSRGTVFKIAPDGTETVLHEFTGRRNGDGSGPETGLIQDKAGNLYGTTAFGGTHGKGTVFKLAPEGTETVLYSFHGRKNGAWPDAGLIKDLSGHLYGTTASGGDTHCNDSADGCGTVFRLKK